LGEKGRGTEYLQ